MFMRKYIVLLLCLISNYVFASFPLEVSDEALIKKTDHVLIGRLVGVDMIDGNGKQIYDLKAKTGPKSQNNIRLIFAIDEVLETNSKSVPTKLFVPLDSFMHFSFGQIKEDYPEVTEQRLLLLSGNEFQPPVAGHFQRNLLDKEYYLELFKTNKSFKQDK
jgi:hypothetical protein